MKNNIKFYEIETKAFFFDKKCSHNVKKEGFFWHPDERKKRKSSKCIFFVKISQDNSAQSIKWLKLHII